MASSSQQPPMASPQPVAPAEARVQPWEYSLRKYLLLLATLVVTVTYSAGFSPPGGVWQDSDDGHLDGDPIIRKTHYARYVLFFYCNATAFAASLVVIVLILIIAVRHDEERKEDDWGRFDLVPLRFVMVVDLVSLVGAYAAGTCRDTVSIVYYSVLVAVVFVYIAVQKVRAGWFSPENSNSNPGGAPGAKEEERLRKVLMLLATFAVSITYAAGLSTPGGFWDSTGPGYIPGDEILRHRHGPRLAVFFAFNTMAFVASLLIIVLLIIDKKLREKTARSYELYACICAALVGLIAAYIAGSARKTDTTFYVGSLVGAVMIYFCLHFAVLGPVMKAIRSTYPWRKLSEFSDWLHKRTTRQSDDGREARSLVLLLSTLAATITYTAGLDPPGGVWQDNNDGHMAGDPILLMTNPRRYKVFFYSNSVAFVASLVAIILVQKELLVKHHALEAAMILDLFGLIGAYAAGSCRDINTSIYAMALAGAVLVYVVIHVVFFTLDRPEDEEKRNGELNKLLEKRRKRLLLFAILAATITYQAGLTPPGGFLPQDMGAHLAGDPVLLYNFPRRYKAFFYCNSVSFMLSIALIILLVNPNLYRPAIRSNALSVCTAAGLFCLMGAYGAGSTQHIRTSIYIFALVALVLGFAAILLLVFLRQERYKHNQRKKEEAAREQQEAERRRGEEEWTVDEERRRAEERSKEEEETRRPDEGNSQDQEAKEAEERSKKEEAKKHARRKYLMLLGILVASVTYQAGLEPPGGAWQLSEDGHEAGNPVMHDNRRPRYLAFFYSNSTSFVASIVVIIMLLPHWLPKKNNTGGQESNKGGKWRTVSDKEEWEKWSLRVMNRTILLDLVALLGAYAAGSSRGWKTSLYVFALIAAVLLYFAVHMALSVWSTKPSPDDATPDVENGGHPAEPSPESAPL